MRTVVALVSVGVLTWALQLVVELAACLIVCSCCQCHLLHVLALQACLRPCSAQQQPPARHSCEDCATPRAALEAVAILVAA